MTYRFQIHRSISKNVDSGAILYVFTIHRTSVRKKHYLYVWPESVASRGSQEIGSCLYKNLTDTDSNQTKKNIIFCDPYEGQTRNLKLTLLMKKCLDSWSSDELITVEQRYFVVGHSNNSCDKCCELLRKKNKISSKYFCSNGSCALHSKFHP